MSRISPWVGLLVAFGALGTLLVWLPNGAPPLVDDQPVELGNQVSPQPFVVDEDSLWRKPFGPRSQNDGPNTNPAAGDFYVRRSLDEMGLGPSPSERVRSLISDRRHALLEIGNSEDNSLRYAVVDLITHKVTSFVAMGARRIPRGDGSLVLIEQDRVWAYRPGWSAIREVPNSLLQIDEAYSAVYDSPFEKRAEENELVLALRSEGASSAQESTAADPSDGLVQVNVPIKEPKG